MFAVITTGGKQYKVKAGDILEVEKLEGDVNSQIAFDKVLLTANDEASVAIGAPYVSGAKVMATILEQGRDDKITIIKYKPKVRYRRKMGHRQHFTKVKIESIA